MAIDPVVINFAARGIADVTRAFESIEQRMERAERMGTSSASRGAQARIRVARSEVDQRKREIEKLGRDVAREQERAARQADQVRRRSAEGAGRYAAQQAREEVREAQKAAREIERIEEWKMRVRIRSSEAAGRAIAREVEKDARRQSQIGRAGTQGLSRGMHTGLRLAGAAAGALSMGGGFAVADAVRKQLSAEKQAALLVNTVTTGSKPPDGATVGNILGQASVLSATTGMDKSELIGGALEYSRKARGGDFKGAMANMPFFAKMAQVTGADINDIAGAAGTLQSQNADLAKDPKAMQQMILDVYAQGKAGSMSMVDVAKQIGTLASTRGSYAGDTATNQRKLLALGQLAAPEGSVEEAGTFVKDMTSEAGLHRHDKGKTKGLESMGVKYDKYGRMESPEQMIEAVLKSTKGDMTKIEGIFGKRGSAIFRAVDDDYIKGGGGEAGLEAVRKKMAGVTGATMTPEQLEAQHEQTMSTPAMRLQAAFEKLESTLGERLEPALSKLADKAPQLAETFGKIADAGVQLISWLADNKWSGLSAIVAGSIAKEIAAAQLGAVLSKGVESSLSGKLAGGIGIAAAAVTIAEVGVMAIDMLADKDVKQQQADIRQGSEALNAASEIDRKSKEGTLTSEDIKKAEAQVQDLRAKGKGDKNYSGISGAGQWEIDQVGPLIDKLFGGGKRAEENARAQKNAADQADLLAGSLARAAERANGFAPTTTSPAPPGPIGQGVR